MHMCIPKNFWRKNIILGAIILAAVLMRLFFALQIAQEPANPGLIVTNGEAARNFTLGRGLVLEGGALRMAFEEGEKAGRLIDPQDLPIKESAAAHYQPFYHDELGYPLFLGILWSIAGESRYILAQLFQIFFAGLAVVGVYRIASVVFSSYVIGLLSAFLYAIYVPEAKLAALPHQYAWTGILIVFNVWLLVEAYKRKESGLIYFFAAFLGVLGGIGAIMRSTLLLVPAVDIIFLFFAFRAKRAIMLSAIVFMFFAFFMISLFLHNSSAVGEGRVTRKTFWHSVAVGLGQFPNPWGILPIDGSVGDFVKKQGYSVDYYPSAETETFLKKEIINEIKENPFWYMGTIAERIPLSLFPFHWAMTQGKIDVAVHDGERVFFRVPFGLGALLQAFIATVWVGLALIGMWLARSFWRAWLSVFLMWGYIVMIHSAILVQPLYMHAVSFVYAMFSAYALYVFFAWVKRHFCAG